MNLFLTEDGVLKLGYYGLTTQAEYYSIKGMNCEGIRSFTYEMSKGGYEMKNDVWSLGIALIELAEGKNPYSANESIAAMEAMLLPAPTLSSSKWSAAFVDFVNKCLTKDVFERWSVGELMSVSSFTDE